MRTRATSVLSVDLIAGIDELRARISTIVRTGEMANRHDGFCCYATTILTTVKKDIERMYYNDIVSPVCCARHDCCSVVQSTSSVPPADVDDQLSQPEVICDDRTSTYVVFFSPLSPFYFRHEQCETGRQKLDERFEFAVYIRYHCSHHLIHQWSGLFNVSGHLYIFFHFAHRHHLSYRVRLSRSNYCIITVQSAATRFPEAMSVSRMIWLLYTCVNIRTNRNVTLYYKSALFRFIRFVIFAYLRDS